MRSVLVVLGLSGALVAGGAGVGAPPAHAAAASASDWLGEVNTYRTAAGLAAVTEQPAWTAGLRNHLAYLDHTPREYRTGAYASDHTENPASPFSTDSGAREAAASDLTTGARNPVAAIDQWWTAPFHAIGMLRPQLRQVGFALDASSGRAGLDVISGLDSAAPASAVPTLFPGPGATTKLTRFGGESPDPTETCGWRGLTVGLPLVILLPSAPDPALSATLSSSTGSTETTAGGDLCVVDEHHFSSSDGVYGPAGAAILAGDHAVLLIPRHPLATATYAAVVAQPGQPDVTWAFSAVAPVTTPATGGLPSHGRPLTFRLTMHRGYATVSAPAWTRGHRMRVDLAKQVRSCRRRRCRWTRTAFSRRYHVSSGARTRLVLPRAARHGRIRAVVTLLAFSSGDGWRYPAITGTGVHD